mgnify:FL=1
MAESKDKLVVAYWDVQALAQPIRWLLAYHKIDFEDKQYKYADKTEWAEKDKPALNSDFPNLPHIKDGDFVITETVAVLQYAALKTGNKDLLGKNPLDAIKLSQFYSFTNDMFSNMRTLVLNKDYDKVRDEVLNEKIAPFLTKLSKNLGEKEYFAGYLTWVDFYIFTQIDVIRRMSPEFLAKWPNLEKYHERFNNSEGIQAYRKSDKHPKFWGPPAFLAWSGEEK